MTGRDTVLTELPGILVATVYGSAARPAANALVALQVVSGAPNNFAEMVSVRPSTSTTGSWTPITTGNARQFLTDSVGRLQLALKLGRTATTARIQIRTVAASVAAPETFTVQAFAGRTAKITPAPRDTAVYVDRTYQIRVETTDAYGNVTTDPVRFVTDSTPTSVSASGIVTGRRIGRAMLRLDAASAQDSVWASVVPRGTLVAIRNYAGGLVQFELDGSAYTVLTGRAVSDPAWSRAGDRLAFVDNSTIDYATRGRIMIRDAASGVERPLIADFRLTGDGDWQVAPSFADDDASVLFAGRTLFSRIVRARVDGSASDTIAKPAPWPPSYGQGETTPDGAYTVYTDPSGSRNGRYVAFSGVATCCVTWVTYIKDLQTQATTKVPTYETPKWLGATDSLVVHARGSFDVLLANGSRVRGVPYPGVQTTETLRYDVSPDGKWLAISAEVPRAGPRVIELLDFTTGMRLPLAFTAAMTDVAWRP